MMGDFRRSWGLLSVSACLLALVLVTPAKAQAEVVVIGNDQESPVLSSLLVSPTSADVSAAAVPVSLVAGAVDDVSGVDGMSFQLVNVAEDVTYAAGASLVDGDALDGTWEATVVLPRYAPSGTYVVRCAVRDAVNRWSDDCPGSFSVTVTGGDVLRPVLSSLLVSPTSADVSAAAVPVSLVAGAVDDVSGARGRQRWFCLAMRLRGPTSFGVPCVMR
ncbi:hypothetical protein [Rhabdothermincola salaria]|uniref:hypothetical protein n=1 Tax=Rhabdothermincola salaria TaxID=2903142 RepID=UPI001E2B53A0|nr:hypothetical protein [Rhabdothermincola salaria]MCD9622773.1 hypothetical protein [Rhabdothermincola salaria]